MSRQYQKFFQNILNKCNKIGLFTSQTTPYFLKEWIESALLSITVSGKKLDSSSSSGHVALLETLKRNLYYLLGILSQTSMPISIAV